MRAVRKFSLLVSACLLAAVFVLSVSAATTELSLSGSAKNSAPVSGSFTTSQTETLTATATFVGKPNGLYSLHLWNAWTDPDAAIVCSDDTSGTATTSTCTVTDAPHGEWFVEFYPWSGKVAVSIVVAAS